MKRSRINELLRGTTHFLEKMNFNLPPFAFWGNEDWKEKGEDYNEIRDNALGWYITDFGQSNFDKTGLLMFTLRNGNYELDKYEKPYAEKILLVKDSQVTPYHFHWNKMEDIINRGGGNLIVKVYESSEDNKLADEKKVNVSIDGKSLTVEPGTELRLTPGESITIPQGLYHSFWSEKGTGTTLVGEVSKVNDDTSDNRFLEEEVSIEFPPIEEDEEPLYLLCNEYPPAVQ